MRRAGIAIGIVAVVLAAAWWGIGWHFTNQALYPAWKIGLDDCPERRFHWGAACGDLRSDEGPGLEFEELRFPAEGPAQPEVLAWRLRSNTANRARVPAPPARSFRAPPGSVAIFVHGGGADRREGARYAAYFLSRGFDYVLPDTICHGASPCGPNHGLAYGARESRSVLQVYAGLAPEYDHIYLMGTSVGANSTLIALPDMPQARAAIVENPMYSTRRFVRETGAAPGFFPGFYRDFLAWLLAARGDFSLERNAAAALEKLNARPEDKRPAVFLIHSEQDGLIPASQSAALAELYAGPDEVWIMEYGAHAKIWNDDPAAYEARLDRFLREMRAQRAVGAR